jgi:hypothetical protein
MITDKLKAIGVDLLDCDEDRDRIAFTYDLDEVSTMYIVSLICDTLNLTTKEFAENVSVSKRTAEGWRSGKSSSAVCKLKIYKFLRSLDPSREPSPSAHLHTGSA